MSQNQRLKQPVPAGKVLEHEMQVEGMGVWGEANGLMTQGLSSETLDGDIIKLPF